MMEKNITANLGKMLQGINYRSSDMVNEIMISGVSSDSRDVKPGDLFVALSGGSVDGHNFIDQAVEKGCAAVLAEKGRIAGRLANDTVKVEVADSRTALGHLAACFYGHPARQAKLIAITGTNGKTTSSYLVESILREAGFKPGVIGTVNYRYTRADGTRVEMPAPLTTPEATVLQRLIREMVDQGVSHVVMEVSSHALAQKRLAGLLFDVAVFTNLSRDHLDFHHDMQDYFNSKKKLFAEHLKPEGRAVIITETAGKTHGRAAEDEICWGRNLAAELAGQQGKRLITCGFDRDSSIRPARFSFDINGIEAEIITDRGTFQVHSRLAGDFNVKNILTATGTAIALGLDCAPIRQGLTVATAVPGRLERIEIQSGKGTGPTVFVDYAHTPDALANVLATLKKLAPHRLICVFGCGGDRDHGKRKLMGKTAGRLSDIVLATSDNPRSEDPAAILAAIEQGLADSPLVRRPAEDILKDGLKSGYDIIISRRRAIRTAIRQASPGDIILISGKGHEDYQISGPDRIFFDDRIEARKNLAALNVPAPHWNLNQVLKATGGSLADSGSADLDEEIYRAVSTDTRTLQPGDLFVTLSGPNHDGLKFAGQAVRKGAAAILAERLPDPKESGPEEPGPYSVPVILVKDTLRALGDLAAHRRGILAKLRVLAITGSSGKTTVKEMTAAILARKLKTLKTEGNLNNRIGMPLTLLRATGNHEVAVLEMGMNMPGEIARLAEIAAPDLSCIVNIQEAHLAGLGDINGVARAKGELFTGTKPAGTLVVNLDDPLVRSLAGRFPGKKISFAATPAGRRHGALLRATHIRSLGEEGMAFTLHLGDKKIRIKITSLGVHSVKNALAAAAMAHGAGISLPDIRRGLEAFRPFDKRVQVETVPRGLKVLNDSYNANPSSMLTALKILPGIKNDRKTAAALGDMLELGKKSRDAHREIGRATAELGYDFLAATGEFAADLVKAARAAGMEPDRARMFIDKNELTTWLVQLLRAGELAAGDWLLLKGSRGMQMETVLEKLQREM